jgi:hypothetical protein
VYHAAKSPSKPNPGAEQTLSFNYEQRSAYSIRVQSEDSGGLSTQRVFTVTITDVFEPPPLLRVAAPSPAGETAIA